MKDLKGFPAVCRGEIVAFPFITNTTQQETPADTLSEFDVQRIEMMKIQYQEAITVYKQNHIEYRQIQAQIMTVISALSLSSLFSCFWFGLGHNGASILLIIISIFSVLISKPLKVSIIKNRHYHRYTAYLIRAIEDNFKIWNMPLRTGDYDKTGEVFKDFACKNGDDKGKNWQTEIKSVTGTDWIVIIDKVFSWLPGIIIVITILVILCQVLDLAGISWFKTCREWLISNPLPKP